MAKKTWNIELGGKKHEVVLDHGLISGERHISVDGKEIELPENEKKIVFDTGSTHQFQIDGHDVAVIIKVNAFGTSYDLVTDGVSQKSGKPTQVKEYTPDARFSNWDMSIYWGAIKDQAHALKIIKEVFKSFLIAAGLQFALSLVIGQLNIFDPIILSLLAVWLYKRQSLVASVLLILVSILIMVLTVINSLSGAGLGGTNIILAVILLVLAIRSFQAVRWLRKSKTVTA